jgi:AcrR family transcriptional regulator
VTEVSRAARRKARTRAALVRAAQGFLASGNTNAPVLEITQAAGVSNGSFYNYFESKEELWQAAVDSSLESVGAYLDSLTVELHDPVEKFTQSFRLSGRSRRDIESAASDGRFDVKDADLALALVAGSLLSMGRLLLAAPDRDEEATVDETTARVLRALGISDDEAQRLCSSDLPSSYGVGVHAAVDPRTT